MTVQSGTLVPVTVRPEKRSPLRLRGALLAGIVLLAVLRIGSRAPAVAAEWPTTATGRAADGCVYEMIYESADIDSAPMATLTCWDLDAYLRVATPYSYR